MTFFLRDSLLPKLSGVTPFQQVILTMASTFSHELPRAHAFSFRVESLATPVRLLFSRTIQIRARQK
jgi:hypothetical protein